MPKASSTSPKGSQHKSRLPKNKEVAPPGLYPGRVPLLPILVPYIWAGNDKRRAATSGTSDESSVQSTYEPFQNF